MRILAPEYLVTDNQPSGSPTGCHETVMLCPASFGESSALIPAGAAMLAIVSAIALTESERACMDSMVPAPVSLPIRRLTGRKKTATDAIVKIRNRGIIPNVYTRNRKKSQQNSVRFHP
jgi:hypothetical protein